MHTPSNTGARAARRTSATPRTPESLLTSGPTVNDLQRKLERRGLSLIHI